MTLRFTAAFFVLFAATALPASAQTYATLHTFSCQSPNCPDGGDEWGGLLQAADGNFYGTTFGGGANDRGIVFKITPGGVFTPVVNFGSPSDRSTSSLIQDIDGAFYGTTSTTIFKLTPNGTLTTLYSNGGSQAALLLGEDGDLYGMGDTIFKITRSGALTTLHEFCSLFRCKDGSAPYYAALIQRVDGNLYGTTAFGGNENYCFDNTGCGTVFRLAPDGTLATIHTFEDEGDGAVPYAGVIEGTDGNLYGTTSSGTVFKLANGQLTSYNLGDSSWAPLVEATDGNFYGTTYTGGTNGYGTIFKITPDGALTTLYSFCSQPNCADGGGPMAALIQATDGNLYGTTSGNLGGVWGVSTIFRLSVGLGPFVRTQNTYGKVGATVNILGTDLTGTTSVTFNGTSATFTVVTATEIKTTVPTGATSGFVEVVTPGGTLSSNVIFRVRQ